MRRMIAFPCFLVCAVVLVLPSRSRAQSAERTLSPHFRIEGGMRDIDLLPLAETRVDVQVSGVIAAVAVRQVYENRGPRPIHAKYVFPASTRAAVNGLRVRIGDRVVEAVIREREQARREYREAKEEGKNAALLEQVRPNVFDMSVANIMPGDRIEVELRYTELLVPTEGVYEFVYPTVVGPRYAGADPAVATGAAVLASVPYLLEGTPAPNEFHLDVSLSAGMPVQWISVPSHSVDMNWSARTFVRVALDDAERHGGDRDFILRYRLADSRVTSGLILGRNAGENFFLLMVEPPERVLPQRIPPREFIFVVDVSGSMRGFPLNTSKELLHDLVSGLREGDTFNVLLFAGGSRVLADRSLPATPANLNRALRFIDDEQGGGGTELPAALERAMALPTETPGARIIVVATDGYITAEAQAFRTARDGLDKASVFAFGIGRSVNRYLVEGLARAGRSEPFVVTDPEEAPAIATRFREYVSAPVLTHVKVSFGELDAYDVEPSVIPDVLADRPVIIQGKWRGDPKGHITVRGLSGEGGYTRSFDVMKMPADGNPALRYLWARSRIADLADEALSGRDDEVRREITRLGLEYNLLTRYTSFIAVDHIVRNPDGSGRDVQQPQPLPEGMRGDGIGQSLQVAPEPELWVLLLVLSGMCWGLATLRSRASTARVGANRRTGV